MRFNPPLVIIPASFLGYLVASHLILSSREIQNDSLFNRSILIICRGGISALFTPVQQLNQICIQIYMSPWKGKSAISCEFSLDMVVLDRLGSMVYQV